MKFINSTDNVDNIDKKEVVEISINKIGRPISEDSERVYAKMKTISNGTVASNTFQVLTHRNAIYDPYGIDSNREKVLELNLKTTNAETYNYFLMFLRTRNQAYMAKAQRSYING
jgi:hypothetical protein